MTQFSPMQRFIDSKKKRSKPAGMQREPDYFPEGSGTGLGQAVQRGDIGSILDEQIRESRRIEDLANQDRDNAVNALGTGDTRRDALFGRLTQAPVKSPFESLIEESITRRINNPEVFSQNDIAGFENAARDSASTAVRDALNNNAASNARRGVAGGVQEDQSNALTIDALQQMLGVKSDLAFRAAEARANNLAGAQTEGSNLINNQRRNELEGFGQASSLLGQDDDRRRAIAEIYAGTERAVPDYSGFAGLGVSMQQGIQNINAQRENLAFLRDQLASSERLGNQDIALRSQIANAQQQYQNDLLDLQKQLLRTNQRGQRA